MFEEVPDSFRGTSSSSSESMGSCFFAFGKSLGFFTSAVVFFPFCVCGLSFLCGDLERSLTRPCVSTAADSSSVFIGKCTGARSRDLDLCRLPELPGTVLVAVVVPVAFEALVSVAFVALCAQGCTR